MSITKCFVSGLTEHFLCELNKVVFVSFGFARNKHLNLGQVDLRTFFFFPFQFPPTFCISGAYCWACRCLKTLPSNLLCLLNFWLLLLVKYFMLLLLKAAISKSVLLWCIYFGIACSMFCQSLCSSAGACKYLGNVKTQTSLFSLALYKKGKVLALLCFSCIIYFIMQNCERDEVMGGERRQEKESVWPCLDPLLKEEYRNDGPWPEIFSSTFK